MITFDLDLILFEMKVNHLKLNSSFDGNKKSPVDSVLKQNFELKRGSHQKLILLF